MKRLMPGRFVALLRGDPTAPLELPSDAVRDGRHRVRVAATMGVVAYGVFLAFALGGARGGTELERTIDRWHDLIGLAYARRCGS